MPCGGAHKTTRHSAIYPGTGNDLAKAKLITGEIADHCPLLLANPQLVTRELSEVLAGMPDATKRKAFLEALDGFGDIEKLTTFVDDLANAPELVVALKGRWELVRAWELVRKSNFSVDVAVLQKINEHLSHFDNGAVRDRVQDLRTAFVNAVRQADFIDGFIGGPLLKSELEELNDLYYRQATTYDDGPGELLSPSELQRIDGLENQLGSHEYPNTISTDSPQFIGNTSAAPQPSPENFWADVKVADGKIEGLIPGKKYDYVITYPFDGSLPELRLGLGHYKISGNALAVKGAGSLRFNAEGKIYYINRQSGHYISIPNSNLQGELDETVNILNANGLTVPDIDVDYNL